MLQSNPRRTEISFCCLFYDVLCSHFCYSDKRTSFALPSCPPPVACLAILSRHSHGHHPLRHVLGTESAPEYSGRTSGWTCERTRTPVAASVQHETHALDLGSLQPLRTTSFSEEQRAVNPPRLWCPCCHSDQVCLLCFTAGDGEADIFFLSLAISTTSRVRKNLKFEVPVLSGGEGHLM